MVIGDIGKPPFVAFLVVVSQSWDEIHLFRICSTSFSEGGWWTTAGGNRSQPGAGCACTHMCTNIFLGKQTHVYNFF